MEDKIWNAGGNDVRVRLRICILRSRVYELILRNALSLEVGLNKECAPVEGE